MPLRDGFFSTATQTSCCNRIQRSNRVRLLVVSTHDFPDTFDPHQTFWEGAPAFFPPLPALSLDEPPLGELRGMVRAASCFPSPSPSVAAVLQVRIPRHTRAACTRCRSRGFVRRLCRGGTRNTCSADVLCRGGDSTCCPAACSVVPPHTA